MTDVAASAGSHPADAPPDLSLVIACFNEEPHLERNVARIEAVLEPLRWSSELIFIDDCSGDRTPEIVRGLVAGSERRHAVFHEQNVGRGGTVAEGIRMARGAVAGFIDVDLEVHCRYIPSMVQAILRDGYDVATAQRVYKINLTPAGILRWVLSVGYRTLARASLRSPFKDTETGFKFFRRESILPVLDRCRDPGWFWDTEVMLESDRAGLRVIEIPALFLRQSGRTSSLRILPDTLAYLRAVSAYRRRHRAERGGGDG